MSGFDFPSNSPVVGEDKIASPAWLNVFSRWHSIILSMQESGTTAQRPTRLLWIGRRYDDTTLGKPVYVRSVNPAVWRDAMGSLDYSFGYDPPSLLDGAGDSFSTAAPGAALGDFVSIAAPYNLQGVLVTGSVLSADVVSVRLQNETGATVDLASGTWKLRVMK